MNKKIERSVLIAESGLVFSGMFLYFYSKQEFDLTDFIVTSMAVIGAVYSITGFFLKFSFFGEYSEDTILNDLIRFGVMLISIVITILVCVFL